MLCDWLFGIAGFFCLVAGELMLPFELPLFEDFFFWPLVAGLFTFELSKIAGPFENCFLT